MNPNPYDLFSSWYSEELQRSTQLLTSACCLSTIGLDEYPNARFVSLKEVTDSSFIITGPLNTRKGMEITNCCKIALTFWWTHTQRQVRIQGDATLLPAEIADSYFQNRTLDARIISTISQQGQPLNDIESLQQKFNTFEKPAEQVTIPCPPDWGGYSIKPIRIEFMEFKQTRLHERVLYQLLNGKWNATLLQP